MKKKDKPQFDAFEAFIEARRATWQDRLGLGHIDIEIVYLDSFYEGVGGDDFVVSATTEGRWNYQQSKIKFYLPSVIRHTDEENEKILVHEYVHVLLMTEQELLDYKLMTTNAKEAVDETEFAALQAMYYERMEMATENVTRSLWKAWGPVVLTPTTSSSASRGPG